MTFGPFGVGRHDGKAVMVPGAVAGDGWTSRLFRSGATTRSRRFAKSSARAPSGAWRRVHICRDAADATGSISSTARRCVSRAKSSRASWAMRWGRDRSGRTGRAGAGRVRLSIENPAQGRRQRRARILRGRQQHDRRDRFVHGRRGGHPDAAAPGAIARQARRRDRGGARRRARGAGRASEEAGDRRGPAARAQRARSGRRDRGNRAAIGHAVARLSAIRQFRSSSNPGSRSTWTPICSAR